MIPVYVLGLTKRQPTIVRKRSMHETIAKVLRDMHNLHGQDPLLLCDKHYDENLQYLNPRNLRIEIRVGFVTAWYHVDENSIIKSVSVGGDSGHICLYCTEFDTHSSIISWIDWCLLQVDYILTF